MKRALTAAALALALAWLVFGTQASFPSERIGGRGWTGDFLSYYLPGAEYLGSRLARAEFPLWDPRHGAGAPFLASLQAGALYPPNWLHALLPTQSAFVTLLALHLALAVVATGALAASLGAGAFGAALAGIVYAGSLRVLSETWTPPLLYTSAWAPALWWSVERALVRPGARSGVALSLALALPLLAGWPYGVAVAALGAGLYALLRLAALAASARRLPLAQIATLALGALAGAALAAPQLLPARELLAQSCRALGSLDAPQAIFVGGPHDPVDFGRALLERGMNDGIPGVLALALAPLAWLRPRATEKLAALLAVGLFGLLVSFPNHAPVYAWLRELPVLGDFRFPYRYRLLTTLALAVAAGIGATRLLARCSGRPARAALALSLLALQIATVTRPLFASLVPFARTAPPAALLDAALQAQGLSPAEGRVLRAGWSGRLRGVDTARVVNDLEPLSLARTAQLLTFFESGAPLTRSRTTGARVPPASESDALPVPYYGRIGLPETPERAAILDLFSVTLIRSDDPPDWLASRYARVAGAAGGAAFANPHALPRARWVPAALPEPRGLQAATARLVAPGFDTRRTVLLDRVPADLGLPPGAPLPESTGALELVHDAAERIVLRSRASAPGVVVLADAWFPGWEARVDGVESPLLRANLAFRAVAVPAGEHEILLRYRPRALRQGVGIAALAALACAAACGAQRRINRARRSPAP